MTQLQKKAIVAFAALSVVGTLAGCSTAAATDTSSGSDTTDTGTSTTDEAYTDGTYEATGSYQSPNGTESVDVSITLENDIITAVEVTGNGESADSKRYQAEFIDGIADVVVGKDIDQISVDKVGGSSLTSGGFNDAVDAIKADALA